jgi:predicted HicB family RNase H-like nuclease
MATVTDEAGSDLRSKRGVTLTGEVLEGLSQEAEAGYDLTTARWERVGRPSLETGVSPRLSFRASRKLYDATRARAEREGKSISEVVREAVERYVSGEAGD